MKSASATARSRTMGLATDRTAVQWPVIATGAFRSPIGRSAVVALLLFAIATAGFAQTSDLKSDEEIIFFPGIGWRAGGEWEVQIRGVVLEPEGRAASVALMRQALTIRQIERTAAEDAMFLERARYFLADNERFKRVVVKFGERRIELEKTRADGLFAALVRLGESEVQLLRQPGTNRPIRFEAVLRGNDTRVFAGEVHLHENTGLTVISDIDDTIKVTQVRDRGETLRNTFLRPFEQVPGMARLYQEWNEAHQAQFVYLSASPWQLYFPLSEMIRSNGFPSGAFQLKAFRWKDQRFFSLFMNPEEYKLRAIEPLFERFPERRFVLVGDSGERDPEIYAALARKYPRRVSGIFIRDVTEEPAESGRYQQTFTNLPPALWTIFTDPSAAELPAEEH